MLVDLRCGDRSPGKNTVGLKLLLVSERRVKFQEGPEELGVEEGCGIVHKLRDSDLFLFEGPSVNLCNFEFGITQTKKKGLESH